ncbi:MAG: uracil-DNA glycosylase [Lentisphaeria bacterium]|nr:uracil-DNA glycosylase [Lentisphaeria bacterium]
MSADFELRSLLPEAWREFLSDAVDAGSFRQLSSFLNAEYREQTVFPPLDDLFTAFRLTPPDRVKAVILGQDPYHDDGQAHGLAFSVRAGVRFPPSLRNIFKELNADLNLPVPKDGLLTPWAEQGVLLLNTVLTVRAHQPASHQKHGWEPFTDAVISELSRKKEHLIYVLWGAPAQAKQPLIDTGKHTVICSAHPSPLSAHRGFFGSRPFSAVNRDLSAHGMKPIDWNLTTGGQSDDLPGLFQ